MFGYFLVDFYLDVKREPSEDVLTLMIALVPKRFSLAIMQRGPQRLHDSLLGHSDWRSRPSLAFWCSRWSMSNLPIPRWARGGNWPNSRLRRRLKSRPLRVTRIKTPGKILPPSNNYGCFFFLVLKAVSTYFHHLWPNAGSIVDELVGQIPNVQSHLEEKLFSSNAKKLNHALSGPCLKSLMVIIHPFIPNPALKPRFLTRLAKGDPTLEMELGSACAAKDDSWNPRDNGCNFT